MKQLTETLFMIKQLLVNYVFKIHIHCLFEHLGMVTGMSPQFLQIP